jgi:hypothetical protein
MYFEKYEGSLDLKEVHVFVDGKLVMYIPKDKFDGGAAQGKFYGQVDGCGDSNPLTTFLREKGYGEMTLDIVAVFDGDAAIQQEFKYDLLPPDGQQQGNLESYGLSL